MNADEKDDGVNREGLDYRAGYVEGLAALLQSLQIQAVRSKKSESAGLSLAFEATKTMRQAMIDKMKGK